MLNDSVTNNIRRVVLLEKCTVPLNKIRCLIFPEGILFDPRLRKIRPGGLGSKKGTTSCLIPKGVSESSGNRDRRSCPLVV